MSVDKDIYSIVLTEGGEQRTVYTGSEGEEAALARFDEECRPLDGMCAC